MQVVYQRCAAVDVGKDVIAVAVRLPGDGPNGRQAIKRTFRTFYGVLAEAARWLVSLGVTHVAIEATGIYSMPVYHALPGHGAFEKVLVCNAGHVKNVPGRKTDPFRRRVAGAPAGVQAAGGQLHPPGRYQGGPGRDPLPHQGSPAAGQRDRPAGQRAAGCRDQDRLGGLLHRQQVRRRSPTTPATGGRTGSACGRSSCTTTGRGTCTACLTAPTKRRSETITPRSAWCTVWTALPEGATRPESPGPGS